MKTANPHSKASAAFAAFASVSLIGLPATTALSQVAPASAQEACGSAPRYQDYFHDRTSDRYKSVIDAWWTCRGNQERAVNAFHREQNEARAREYAERDRTVREEFAHARDFVNDPIGGTVNHVIDNSMERGFGAAPGSGTPDDAANRALRSGVSLATGAMPAAPARDASRQSIFGSMRVMNSSSSSLDAALSAGSANATSAGWNAPLSAPSLAGSSSSAGSYDPFRAAAARNAHIGQEAAAYYQQEEAKRIEERRMEAAERRIERELALTPAERQQRIDNELAYQNFVARSQSRASNPGHSASRSSTLSNTSSASDYAVQRGYQSSRSRASAPTPYTAPPRPTGLCEACPSAPRTW